MEIRKWEEVSLEEKADIVKDRLLHPEETVTAFAKKHNVLSIVIKRLQNVVNFNEDTATASLMNKVLKNDNKLVEMASDINIRYAEQVGWKKHLAPKDLEVLDKLANTSMKRAALVHELGKGEEDRTMNITLTF